MAPIHRRFEAKTAVSFGISVTTLPRMDRIPYFYDEEVCNYETGGLAPFLYPFEEFTVIAI
eukprot:scaffold4468_cov129-Cylindrotheca_fusiformis.AAC.3